jgi:hypothetical protein
MEPNTLKQILTDAGIPPATVKKVLAALEKSAGPYSPRSRVALIRTAPWRWEMHKVVQSRLGESDGGPEWFTIHHIKI